MIAMMNVRRLLLCISLLISLCVPLGGCATDDDATSPHTPGATVVINGKYVSRCLFSTGDNCFVYYLETKKEDDDIRAFCTDSGDKLVDACPSEHLDGCCRLPIGNQDECFYNGTAFSADIPKYCDDWRTNIPSIPKLVAKALEGDTNLAALPFRTRRM